MNRDVFFREVRASLFRGKINQSQVEGTEALLNIWHDFYSDHPIEHLAYCLATSYHETGSKMQPVREGFAKTDAGAISAVNRLYRKGRISRNYAKPDPKTGKSYFGRGHVQLTWDYNYKKMTKRLGIDFYNHPEKALEPENSAHLLFVGCLEGMYTGKSLSDYIKGHKINYRQARRVVNGMDKASLIAGYAKKFEYALDEAISDEVTERKLEQAGSRTIKHAKGGKDAGGAIIGIGVIGMFSKILEQLKAFSSSLGEWASSLNVISDAFSSIASLWPFGLLVCGGLAFWRYTQIIKARIADEPKIGRLENASTPD